MVLNGCELGGGSIRIHDQSMQETVFESLGISEDEQQEEVRLPARWLEVRCAPARWFGLRLGSLSDADDRF